jgi:hypothetical protein
MSHTHGAIKAAETCTVAAVAAKVTATDTARSISSRIQILFWLLARARRALDNSTDEIHGNAKRNATIKADVSTLSEPQKLIGDSIAMGYPIPISCCMRKSEIQYLSL